MSETQEARCVLIVMGGERLLLPAAAVVAVLEGVRAQNGAAPTTPATLEWSGHRLPRLTPETLGFSAATSNAGRPGGPTAQHERTRVGRCAIVQVSAFQYVALETEAVPRMVGVDEDDLLPDSGFGVPVSFGAIETVAPSAARYAPGAHVWWGDGMAWIPDLANWAAQGSGTP